MHSTDKEPISLIDGVLINQKEKDQQSSKKINMSRNGTEEIKTANVISWAILLIINET